MSEKDGAHGSPASTDFRIQAKFALHAPVPPQCMPSLRLSMMEHGLSLLAASLARQSLDGLPATTFGAHRQGHCISLRVSTDQAQ